MTEVTELKGLPSTQQLSTAPGVEATGLTRANHAIGQRRFQARKVPMSAPFARVDRRARGVDRPFAYLCLRTDRRGAARRTEARREPLTKGNRVRPWSDLRMHMDGRREIDRQRDQQLTKVATKSDLIAKARLNGPGSAWRQSIDRSMLAGLIAMFGGFL